MAVLISHSLLDELRMADRILVLQGGELVDQGTHEDWWREAGCMPSCSDLQAAGYR